jgi:hypothetical protein
MDLITYKPGLEMVVDEIYSYVILENSVWGTTFMNKLMSLHFNNSFLMCDGHTPGLPYWSGAYT